MLSKYYLLILFNSIGETVLFVLIVLIRIILLQTTLRYLYLFNQKRHTISPVTNFNPFCFASCKILSIVSPVLFMPFIGRRTLFIPTTDYRLPTTYYQLPTTNYQLPTSLIFPSSPAIYSHRWVKYPESCSPDRSFQVLYEPAFGVLLWIRNVYLRNQSSQIC